MNAAALSLGVGCMLQSGPSLSSGDIYKALIGASPTCSHVDIPFASGQRVELVRARVHTSQGTRVLEPERLEHRTRDAAGFGALRLHTPELTDGDTLRVRYRLVEATYEGGDAPLAEPLPMVTPLTTRRHDTLDIPWGDPQVALYPGGGARTQVFVETTFAASDVARAWVLPLRSGTSEISHTVAPTRGAALVVRDDSLLVLLQPTETKVRVDIRWSEPDAATYGTLPDDGSHTVQVDDGLLGWNQDGRRWWLVGVHQEAVLPNAEALRRALTRRFDAARLREPALPPPLRGARPDLRLLASLTDYVRQRAAPVTWPHEPTLPRPIARAFREGAMSEVEAALALHALLQQAGFESSWHLTRPLSGAPEHDASLSKFDYLILRVRVASRDVWVDIGHPEAVAIGVRPALIDGRWIGALREGIIPAEAAAYHE